MSVLLPLDVNLFLTQTLVIFLLHAKQLGNSILVISLWGVIFLYLRWFCYSYAWSCNLWKLWRFLFMFSTAFLHLLSWFIFLYQSPSSSLWNDFHAISSKINIVLSINRSANVFAFGDFNKVYHKDWLTYSCGTGRPNELCYNFSRKTFLRWLTFKLGWIYFSFDLSISSTVAFSIRKIWSCCGLSSHWFPVKLKKGCPSFFHYNLWLFLCRLGWSSWLFEIWSMERHTGASVAAAGFCEWIKVGNNVCISHCKY